MFIFTNMVYNTVDLWKWRDIMNYDVIVIGGGHAGCEACLAASRLGKKTLLVTGNKKNIADGVGRPLFRQEKGGT